MQQDYSLRKKINEALNKFIASAQWSNQNKHISQSPTGFVSSPASVLFKKVFDNNEQDLMVADTIIVGAQINDTLVITGNFTHTGPFWFLITGFNFNQATVVDTGEIYVLVMENFCRLHTIYFSATIYL